MKPLSLITNFLPILLLSCTSERREKIEIKKPEVQQLQSKETGKAASIPHNYTLDTIQIPDEISAIGKVHQTGGVFHDGEVLPKIEELEWVGLFSNEHGYYLKKTTIITGRAKDEIVDEDNEISGWTVNTDNKDYCHLLINGVERLGEGRIDSFILEKEMIWPGESSTFKTKAGTFILSATGKVISKSEEWQEVENYKLYIERVVDDISKKQVIAAIPRFDDAMVKIIWCGDLDKDEQPDFIINTSNHYNMISLSLFLSSKATEGQVLRFIGTHSNVGC